MSLQCDVVIDAGVTFNVSASLADLLKHAGRSEPLTAAGCWRMTLRVCDDFTIAELHERFFADPTPTDVISFPDRESAVEGEKYLGDVVVSIETAAAQAVDAGHSLAREVAFLALHGLLHLCGHDDARSDEREGMLLRQQQILEAWERDQGRLL
ncbi:MAG: rRNA maturation RNase YbeY [Thermomicrobiales bacterium]